MFNKVSVKSGSFRDHVLSVSRLNKEGEEEVYEQESTFFIPHHLRSVDSRILNNDSPSPPPCNTPEEASLSYMLSTPNLIISTIKRLEMERIKTLKSEVTNVFYQNADSNMNSLSLYFKLLDGITQIFDKELEILNKIKGE